MIWVVGARGMLGQEVVRRLDELGLQHIDSDMECDITQSRAVVSFAETAFGPEHRPRWVINCAAYTAVDQAEDDEESANRVNAQGPANLAAWCRNSGAAFIHVSTDYVFDGTASRPYSEGAAPNPLSVYGRTKVAGERLVQEALSRHIIVRTAWLYGTRGRNFVFTMLKLMQEGSPIRVVDDQHGAPTYAAHLAAALCEFVRRDSNAYGIYHYTNGGETTWYGFAGEIGRRAVDAGLLAATCDIRPVSTEEYRTRARRPGYSVLSTAKIEQELGLDIPSWQRGLEDFFIRMARERETT